MFGSEILEVAIALIFIYFLMSLLCSVVTEYLSGKRKLRPEMLKQGIRKLLGEDDTGTIAGKVFGHSLFTGITRKKKPGSASGEKDGPSNLSARSFSLILFDTLLDSQPVKPVQQPGTAAASYSLTDIANQTIADIETKISQLPNTELKKSLNALLNSAKMNVENAEDVLAEFQSSIEKWYDDAMDRVSGWYKRKTQPVILAIALIACAVINVDTFVIADSLFQDSTLRESIIAEAEKRVEQQAATGEETDIVQIREELEQLQIPLWWNADAGVKNLVPDDFAGWLMKLAGILVSALAVSLGAPFWFDLLSRFINMRSSGKKPDKGEKTATLAVVQ